MLHNLFVAALGVLYLSAPAQAQQLSDRTGANSPEEELAGFTLPEGFIIELVASEQDGIVKPVDLTFDDAGRLWTQTARMYPLDPVADIQWNDLLDLMNDREKQKEHPAFKRVLDLYQGKTRGEDQILVISNLYGKNGPEVRVWADGLANPMSILPYKTGAYIAQGSELFFLDDTNQDHEADSRVPLFTGFGYTDSHTMTHLLTRGPGGWIYFSHGALNKGEVSSYKSNAKADINYSKIGRFTLDAARLELVSSGLNNIWGFQLRGNGQWYGSEANDLGYSVVPLEPGTGFPGIGNDRLRPYQPFMPPLHEFRVGGTGLSGIAFNDDDSGSFPDEWKDVAFIANPITSTINAVRVTRNPDGTVSAEHLPDLLKSKDDWFRPVNLKFGPDGSLYIADWYNKIISHNEVPTTHPDRDKSHGRIWRIRHISQQPGPVPDFYEMETTALTEYLQSPSLWEKRAAWHQIAERPVAATATLVQPLGRLLADPSQEESARIHALWSLEAIGHYDPELWNGLLQQSPDNLRREAIRALSSFPLGPKEIAKALEDLIEDPNPMIRSQVLRTLGETGKADENTIAILVQACKPELPGNTMGGSYERRFERYLARKALELYPEALQAYLQSDEAKAAGSENLLWAIQALPQAPKETAFLEWWPRAGITELDESTFVAICSMLANKTIYEQVRSVIEDPAHAEKYLRFALANQSQVQSTALARLLRVPVQTLLQQRSREGIDLALDVTGRFNVVVPGTSIAALFSENPSGKTIELIIKALEGNPGAGDEIFNRIVQNKQLSFDLRATALHSLAKTNTASAQPVLRAWLPTLSDTQKRTLAETLSGSVQGAGLLKDSYDKKLIGTESFTLSTAERIQQSQPEDSRGTIILAAVKKQQETIKQATHKKLGRYISIAEKKGGNPVKGALLFQTCQMCHSVGNKGVNLGPALDGSANRDNEALLTAILDPDAAVESGYAAYRITRKDGSNYQGLLVDKNDRGATIAFMGGSTLFIEAADIKSQGFLPGRSFMPKGLIEGFTDEQVADLLAYIRTLK